MINSASIVYGIVKLRILNFFIYIKTPSYNSNYV